MKTKPLKIFLTAKENLASIYLNENQCAFHCQQLLRVVQGVLAIILQCLYLVFDANNTRECMNSILMITVGCGVFIAYLSTIFQTKTIYDFIIEFEKSINES